MILMINELSSGSTTELLQTPSGRFFERYKKGSAKSLFLFVREKTMNTILTLPENLTMSSREIADLIGKEHKHVMRDLRTLREQLGTLFEGSVQTWTHPQNGQAYDEFVIKKDTCLTLLLGYDAVARMKVIKRWQELEAQVAMPAPAAPVPKALPNPMVQAVEFAEAMARMLNLEGSARLSLARSVTNIVAPHLLPALPSYAIDAPKGSVAGSSEPTTSLTTLLKQKGLKVSPVKANQVLQKLSIIEQLTRPSSTGIERVFWSVTPVGMKYGKNVTSPTNQRETQPHWFMSQANSLIDLIVFNIH